MPNDNLSKAIFQAARAWRSALDQRLKPFNISQAKWRLLLMIDRHKQSLNQKELAAQLGVESPSIVGLIDRMARDKWIHRVQSKIDRRINVIKLTAKGAKLVKQIRSIADQLKAETIEQIPQQERQQCINVLEKATALLNAS